MGYHCLIEDGITAQCNDLRKVGGVDKRFWLFNTDGLNRAIGTEGFTIGSGGHAEAIAFNSYGGLQLFVGKMNSHSAGVELVNNPGANKFFKHTVTAKLFNSAPWDDVVLQDMAVAHLGAIVETQNEEFYVYGPYNGLDVTAMVRNTGTDPTGDVSIQITMEGAEKILPLRFFKTSYAASLALLVGYEV